MSSAFVLFATTELSVAVAKSFLFESIFADANSMFLHQLAHGGTDSCTVLLFYNGERAVGFVDGQNAVVVLTVVVGGTTNPIKCHSRQYALSE